MIEVLDERLDEAAECPAHRVQCIPAPIREIRYAYIVDHGDEASQSKPAQALSHLLSVAQVAIEVADRFCPHQTLREPRHAVHSLPNGEVRLVLPIEDLYCSSEHVEMHLEVPWAGLFNEPVDIVQEPVGRQSGAQSASRQHEANTRKHSRQALWPMGRTICQSISTVPSPRGPWVASGERASVERRDPQNCQHVALVLSILVSR